LAIAEDSEARWNNSKIAKIITATDRINAAITN
jgi:hypothetical protein